MVVIRKKELPSQLHRFSTAYYWVLSELVLMASSITSINMPISVRHLNFSNNFSLLLAAPCCSC